MPTRTGIRTLCAVLALTLSAVASAKESTIAWRSTWSQALFDQAQREHRFVLLDLHAVWCHWCHVMDAQTYADPAVKALIAARYLPVSIDADSDPALVSRYGQYGWPATIVLAPDGTEIVKRRGFIAPQQMASLLKAIIDDPTPGPSVQQAPVMVAHGSALTNGERDALKKIYDEAYDAKLGGWGSGQKFIDAPTLEYTMSLVLEARDPVAERRARQTLDANLKLIDPVWGGVFQYSATPDWASPHFEKLLSFQADDLRIYSQAYARWHEERYLEAARALEHYMNTYLRSPEGAFYVSQDADLSAAVTGHDYYRRDAAARQRLGIPRIDRHLYARENGWAIRALCAFYDTTGDQDARTLAVQASEWALAQRALPGGGFTHDASDTGGPFLDDTLSMGEAFLALYRSTGDRQYLAHARAALGFIVTHFRDARGGFISAPAPQGAVGVFREPARSIEENAALARFANLLAHYTADKHDRDAALHAMRYLAAAVPQDELRTDVLLADHELSGDPIHITVVGGKSDPAALALHSAALAFPAHYLQVDWWDRREGPLPDPEVRYPQLARAAAFACTGNSCSLPVFDPTQVARTVTAALYQ